MDKYTPNKNIFAGKKVLVFGLGLLGGGVATTNWLLKQGAKVTVTDLKDKTQLESSLKQIKGKLKLKLGGHDEDDIKQNDIIIFNPDVPEGSKYVQLARKLDKIVENEATIFYKLCGKPIVAVTGTRGKTTTANWLGYFLNLHFRVAVTGNATPGFVEPLLKTVDRLDKFSMIVNEIPSFHLEFFDNKIRPPETAVITNIYQDHLNRYKSFNDYVKTKSKIFGSQTLFQNLVLNYDNKWTPFLMKQKPQSQVWFFSAKTLPTKVQGIFRKGDSLYVQSKGSSEKVLDIAEFANQWGVHNLENLMATALVAHLHGVFWSEIQQKMKTLPQIPLRQEVIFESPKIKIINDTTATSPDGGIAAVKRFGSPNCVLITGGTDRQLDYLEWGKVVPKYIKPENIVILAGSASDKMLKSFGKTTGKINVRETLVECVALAMEKAGKFDNSVVLFSPAAKSFEKFKNEYDRGEQFNALVRKAVKSERNSRQSI